MASELFTATRFAIKFDPPTILCEYKDSTQKKRTRAVKLQELEHETDMDKLTKKVIRSLPRRMDLKSVSKEQVKRLLTKLTEHRDGGGAAAGGGAGGGAGRALGGSSNGTGLGGLPPLGGSRPTSLTPLDVGGDDGDGGDRDGAADLNKVSPEELKAAKERMDENFNKNRKLPGQADFVYNVEVDFLGPTEDNDWDDDDDFVESDEDDVFG